MYKEERMACNARFTANIDITTKHDTTLRDKVWQWLAVVSSTNKTDGHNIAEILLKVALDIITLTLQT